MRKISDSEKDGLVEAQKQVIGILFEVIKRLQANNDLDEEYFQIVASKKTQNKKRLDKILSERQENSKIVSKLLKQLEI
ncbi:MAG: Hydrolase [Nitrosopumilales archaeon]|nr:MAG: Hydrolase [Nitrosopumilales archaeon]